MDGGRERRKEERGRNGEGKRRKLEKGKER